MYRVSVLLIAIFAVRALPARAVAIGTGANAFNMEFVIVGDPGNPADTQHYGAALQAGAVTYLYRISKFEITERAIDAANALGGLGISKDTRGPDKPATSVTWIEAARFANWLNTTVGASPAYKFDAAGAFQLWTPADPGYDATNRFRNTQAIYFLPNSHEWQKAAYYDPDSRAHFAYPHRSNSPPDGIDFPSDPIYDMVFYDGALPAGPYDAAAAGTPSPWGTVGQGGNVIEWVETEYDLVNDSPGATRLTRGGSWLFNDAGTYAGFQGTGGLPSDSGFSIGFRIAAIVPEPTSCSTCMAMSAVLLRRRVRRQTC